MHLGTVPLEPGERRHLSTEPCTPQGHIQVVPASRRMATCSRGEQMPVPCGMTAEPTRGEVWAPRNLLGNRGGWRAVHYLQGHPLVWADLGRTLSTGKPEIHLFSCHLEMASDSLLGVRPPSITVVSCGSVPFLCAGSLCSQGKRGAAGAVSKAASEGVSGPAEFREQGGPSGPAATPRCTVH